MIGTPEEIDCRVDAGHALKKTSDAEVNNHVPHAIQSDASSKLHMQPTCVETDARERQG